MRRGLISWSRTELPERVFDARVARVQAAMAKAGVDALAIYSDPARSGGASWLTGFVPYWNRGVVVLTRNGRPLLLTGMSNRVHGWIKRNAHLQSIGYSTDIGADAAKLIANEVPGAIIAVPDLNSLPGGIANGLATGGATVIDGTALLSQARAPCDPAELALYFRACAIARAALAKISRNETDAAAMTAAIDGEARRSGAEECYIALAPDLDSKLTLLRLEGTARLGRSYAVRVSVAYKGTWVRMLRTVSRDPAAAPEIAAANERFAGAVALLPGIEGLRGLRSWLIEGCRATQPLEPLAGAMIQDAITPAPGTIVTVQTTIDTPAGPVLVGGPALIGHAGEAASLLTSPQFDD
jgi:hypothetical protein